MKYKEDLRNDVVTLKHKLEAAEYELNKFKWISVDDRLPEVGSSVLVYFNGSGRQLVTYRMPHGNFSPQWQYDSMRNGVATHWMSSPEAPKL